MTTFVAVAHPIIVSHRDGSFYATPSDDLAAGLLNGMIEASRWSTRVNQANIAWIDITEGYAKGEVNGTGERVIVMPANLSMRAEDELNAWIYENDN